VSWVGKPASTSTPTSMSTTRARSRVRVRSSSQLRRCYGPCPLPRRSRCRTCTARHQRSSGGRATGRKLGVSHTPAGQRAG
jgi:hypothetical protein